MDTSSTMQEDGKEGDSVKSWKDAIENLANCSSKYQIWGTTLTEQGELDFLHLLIENNAKILEEINSKVVTDDEKTKLLHFATKEGKTEEIKELIKESTDINERNDLGWTPLHLAALFGRSDCLNILIKKKGDVNKRSKVPEEQKRSSRGHSFRFQ
jgi:ankyrin repeat protein